MSSRSWLCFETEKARFGILVEEVERLIPCEEQELYPLPIPEERIVGLINVQGQAVPVLILPELETAGSVFLVVNTVGDRFAFRIKPPWSIWSAESAEEAPLNFTKLTAASLWQRK